MSSLLHGNTPCTGNTPEIQLSASLVITMELYIVPPLITISSKSVRGFWQVSRFYAWACTGNTPEIPQLPMHDSHIYLLFRKFKHVLALHHQKQAALVMIECNF